MTMTATLDDQVQAWLAVQDKTGVNNVDYRLVDHSDGKGAQIGMWNAATFGPQPTQAELDSVTPQAEAIALAREQSVYMGQVQVWLDATAREYNYADMVAACSYAVSAIELWQRQGLAFATWRDGVWQAVFAAFSTGEPFPPLEDLPQPEIPAE
jgi:hypothetical protein